MTSGWYQLPEMDIEDDGHFIMLKRMVSGDDVHIISGYGHHSSGMSPSRSAMIFDKGAYGVQYDFLSLMDAATFIYARNLTWGPYFGIWVQWKNPRDW